MAEERAEADTEFGARLKAARDGAKLSTAQLAEQLFLTRESVDRYMRGERRPSAELVARWEELCAIDDGSLVAAHHRLPPRRAPFGRTTSTGAAPQAAAPSVVAAQGDIAPDTSKEGPAAAATEPAEDSPKSTLPPADMAIRRRALIGAATVVMILISTISGLLLGQSLRPATTVRTAPPAPGPSRGYQLSLNTVLAQLERSRRKDLTTLKAATSPITQANAAARLREDHTVAAAALAATAVAPRELAAHRRIVRAITSTRNAYRRMADAARHGSVARYERAITAVSHAERRLQAAVRALARLGYP